MLFGWFIPKKYKKKYKLDYITHEMYRSVSLENLKMYETIMEKKSTLFSEKTDNRFRKEYDRLSNETFKAVKAQENDNYRNAYKVDALHKFQMERRLMCWDRFKELLLTIEFHEEQMYLNDNCKAIDVHGIKHMLKFKHPKDIEFYFNDDFYNAMFKAMKELELVEIALDNIKSETPIKEGLKVVKTEEISKGEQQPDKEEKSGKPAEKEKEQSVISEKEKQNIQTKDEEKKQEEEKREQLSDKSDKNNLKRLVAR